MKRTNPLSDLLMEELAELLNVENQLAETLPKMMVASHSLTLKFVLEVQLEVTKGHVDRLQDIFSNTRKNPQRVNCRIIKNFIRKGEFVVNKAEKSPTRDAAIISLVQQVEQYEITEYQKACEHAIVLGHSKIVQILDGSLNEERSMNLHLNELVQGMINAQAIDPSGSRKRLNQQQGPPFKSNDGGFYIPEGRFNRGGKKKKSKNIDVSRFMSEGNPNIQEPKWKEGEDDQN